MKSPLYTITTPKTVGRMPLRGNGLWSGSLLGNVVLVAEPAPDNRPNNGPNDLNIRDFKSLDPGQVRTQLVKVLPSLTTWVGSLDTHTHGSGGGG